MNKLWALFVAGLLVVSATPAGDNKKEVERVENSGTVIKEILDIPDDIPQSLLDKSECVVVLPSVLKAAFIVAAVLGVATLWMAIVADTGASLIVIANALRLLRAD